VDDCQLFRHYYVAAPCGYPRGYIVPPCALASSAPREGLVVEFCLLESRRHQPEAPDLIHLHLRKKLQQMSNIPFAAKVAAQEPVVGHLPHCPPCVPLGVHVGVHVASRVCVQENLTF